MFATLLILSSKFIERIIISVNLLADIFRYFPCVWICSTSNWNLNAWRIWIPMISTPIYESFYFNIFENVAKFMITRSIRKMLTSWHSILITPTDISSVRVICVWACASVLMFFACVRFFGEDEITQRRRLQFHCQPIQSSGQCLDGVAKRSPWKKALGPSALDAETHGGPRWTTCLIACLIPM